jgi:hypothetical protein
VTLCLEQAAKMMRAATGLNSYDTRRQAFGKPRDARWPHPPPFDDLSLTIQSHKTAAVLTKIYSKNRYLHRPLSRTLKIASHNNPCWPEGGPSHKLP